MRRYTLLLGLVVICIGVICLPAQKKPQQQARPEAAQGSPEQNKVMARRVFEELYSQGRFNAAHEVFDPSCKVHFGNRTLGLAEAIAEAKEWKVGSPDSQMIAQQVNANGDKVTVEWLAQGTHSGRGMGINPTGRRFSMRERSEFLIRNGKIVEVWNNEYRTELFRQLGVSKTAASLFFATERVIAAMASLLPQRLYTSLLD